MIEVHYASLTSQGVQHSVFYLDGHPSRYQPRPTGLNFGEQMGTGVFFFRIAAHAYHLVSFLHRPWVWILNSSPFSLALFNLELIVPVLAFELPLAWK